MVRIFVKRDSTNWGYDSTSKSSVFFCRTVLVEILGRCGLNSKLVWWKGTPFFSSTVSQGANRILVGSTNTSYFITFCRKNIL